MERNILLAIVSCAVVTALMRTVPILLLSRFRLAVSYTHLTLPTILRV